MGEEKKFDMLPVGPLGVIAVDGCQNLVSKVNQYLVEWRQERGKANPTVAVYEGYDRDTYLVETKVPRFGSGEGKGVIETSVRGDDLYIVVDVCNYSMTYSLRGKINHMSPDDHFQNLKRIIAAVGGKAKRITVIMPFLYESRQHKRSGREYLTAHWRCRNW